MSDVKAGTDFSLFGAQARLHQHYFIGLQLMVATRAGSEVVRDWMFELFSRQHEEKFLSSFKKLGLEGLPDAVASARYHVLSNGVGGVQVEYMEESETKAWVRYRYPRWWLEGPAVCGIPIEASEGFMRGWHARNGVSLGNPRLGFVCVSEDMTGEFGLCGYWQEFDRALAEDERLQYAKHERPPDFDPDAQPTAPAAQWNEARLAKANRNYAVEFVRNGVLALSRVVPRTRAIELASNAARLIGLQQYPELARAAGAEDAGVEAAGQFLVAMFAGMGDEASIHFDAEHEIAEIEHRGLRITRGLSSDERQVLLSAWTALWQGTIASHRVFMDAAIRVERDALHWTIARQCGRQ